MIRTAWLLLKLLRQLHIDSPPEHTMVRGVELRLMVEPDSSFEKRCEIALDAGAREPKRDSRFEVSYWPIAGLPCYTQRGETLAEALSKALKATFPAPLS